MKNLHVPNIKTLKMQIKIVIIIMGKLHLLPMNFGHFYKCLPMFETSYLGVLKFGFLSLCPFRTKNPKVMTILPLTPKPKLHCFGNGIVLESRVKFAFSVQKRQSERKLKFDTPKCEALNIRRIFAKMAKVQGE
jgi:hypothetical protein